MAKKKGASKNTRKRFVLVDSFNLIHRAYHAYPRELRSLDGTQVNVVFGFTSMLLRVLEQLEPDYIACAFDVGKPTWRHAELVAYKKNRKKPENEMMAQIPLVRHVVSALNIPILEFEGYEADDVVGTVSRWVEDGRWKKEDIELIIVSGDADILQLVRGRTKVWLPKKSFKDMVMYDNKEVVKKYGFEPEKIPDYKALVGDASDNIPGVSGIGDVMATKLIKEFGSVENVYKNIEKVENRAKNKLAGQEEIAYLSKRIATIVEDVPLDVKIGDCHTVDFDLQKALDLFVELGFRSLINRIKKVHGEEGYPDEQVVIKEEKDMKDSQINLFDHSPKSKKSETRKVKGGKIVDIEAKNLKLLKNEEYVFAYNNEKGFLKGSKSKEILAFSLTDAESVQTLLSSDAIIWGYDLKSFFKKVINIDKEHKIPFNLLDVQVMAYLIVGDRRDYSLDAVVFEFLKEEISDRIEGDSPEKTRLILDKIFSLKENFLERIGDMKFLKKRYAWDGLKADSGPREVIKTPLGKVFYYIDNPCVYVLAHMEYEGIKIDQKELITKKKEFINRLEKIEKKIYKSVGHEFKINSPRQLSEILFSELDLPKTRRMKTGYSTDEESLEEIKSYHPLPKLIIEYRKISKLLSTYIEALSKKVEEDGRIRTTYNHIGTSTGRLASTDPNLQNIPIREEEGEEIRKLFVSETGKLFVKVDYSQIDLRVLADQTEDRMLLESFKKGYDIHTRTAAMIFNKKLEDVTKNERRIGKTVNFGITYGLSPFGLARELDISNEDASKYIHEYFNTYPGVEDHLNETIQFVKDHQYVETMFGRRRYIYNIDASNRVVQMAAQREAINMPIQGAATGDIMRLAMTRLFTTINDKYRDYARILLQVHDEFLFEVDEKKIKLGSSKKEIKYSEVKRKSSKLAEFLKDVEKIMCEVIKLKVPLDVDLGIGHNWKDIIDVKM